MSAFILKLLWNGNGLLQLKVKTNNANSIHASLPAGPDNYFWMHSPLIMYENTYSVLN